MKVLAKVLDVTTRQYRKDGEVKTVADIVFKSGTDTMTATMFDGDVQKGAHKVYDQLVGKEAIVDISPDVYRGNLQYRLGFEDPRPVGPKSADKAA